MLTPERAAALAASVARMFGVPPPVVRFDPNLPYKGLYRDGVIYLRPDADERVVIHEAAHHVHWVKGVRNGRVEEFASVVEDLFYRYPELSTGKLLALLGVSMVTAFAFTAASGRAPKHPRDVEGWWNVALTTVQNFVASLAAAALLG